MRLSKRAGSVLFAALAACSKAASTGAGMPADGGATVDSATSRDSAAQDSEGNADAADGSSVDGGLSADTSPADSAPKESGEASSPDSGGGDADSGYDNCQCGCETFAVSADIYPDDAGEGGVEYNPFKVQSSDNAEAELGDTTICYTLDGGPPACSAFCSTTCAPSSQTYSGPIAIGPSVTNPDSGVVVVSAVACPGQGDGNQYVTAQTYTLTVSPVVFVASGTCPQTETLSIDGTFGATVCYSFDGTPVSPKCTPVSGHVYCFSSGANGMQTNTGAGQPAISVSSSTTVATQTCLAGFHGAAATQVFPTPASCP